MEEFNKKYAGFYDVLYRDKDYEEECDFLESIFKKYNKKIKTILDLGCGTGGHALILAKRGYKVTGIDRSKEMLNIARKKSKKSGLEIDFYESSIQDLRLNRTFDVVISMFAVMGYQIENKDLAQACATAKQHLGPNGVFIFDAWYGPAVLLEPPMQKVKETNIGNASIIRITNPKLNVFDHTSEINFRVLFIKNKRLISETEETHTMRFLFPQEIKYFLETVGFSKIVFTPFLNLKKQLTEKDWNMTVIAR